MASSSNLLLDTLSSLPVFQKLSASVLHTFMTYFEKVKLQEGETLVTEGQIQDLFGIIEEGELHGIKRHEEQQGGHGQKHSLISHPKEIVFLPGHVFGLDHLFNEKRASITYVALKKPCALYLLHRNRFHTFLATTPDAVLPLLSMLATHPIHATTSSQHERGGDSMDRPDDGSMTTVPSKTTTTTSTLKVTFFDVKPYQMDSFMEQNEQTFHYDLHFLQEKLSLTTVHLAQGSDVVCVFVHDQLDAPVVHQLHHLGIRLIAFRCAGFDMCDVAVCDQLNVSVVRVPGYSPNAIAEHACAMMLSLNRKLIQANRKVHMGDFSLDGLVGFDMKGKTVGIIGTGKIGACLVQILLGFGCHVICHDVYKNPMLLANPLVQYVSFDDLIQRSDIISLHAPLLKDTFHLIHGDVFKKMKRGVMLINTSRGPLVDTEALIEALKSGQVGSCGLDVLEGENDYFYENKSTEIMTNDNIAKLLAFHNHVLITAHQAYLTKEALREIALVTLTNIQEFQAGKRLKALSNSVNQI